MSKQTQALAPPGHARLRLYGKSSVGPTPKAETEAPAETAVSFDPGLHCHTCKQPYGSVDIHSTSRCLLSWPKTNTLKDGIVKATGRECGPCCADRMKRQKGKSQDDVTEQNNVPAMKEENMEHRKNYVQGITKYRKVEEGSQGANVMQSHSEFSKHFGEGYFYDTLAYIRILEPEKDITGWTSRMGVKYMHKSHPEVPIFVDKSGDFGCRESNLPQGAKYKYQEGTGTENAFQMISKFDTEDADVAVAAFTELQDEDGVGPREVIPDTEEGNYEEDEVPQANTPIKVPPASVARKQTPSPSPRAASPISLGPAASLASLRVAGRTFQKMIAAAPSVAGGSDGNESIPVSKATSQGDASSADGLTVDADANAPINVVKLAAQLRSSKPAKVIEAAKEIVALTRENFSNRKLWDGGFKSRGISGRAELCATASHRVAVLDSGTESKDVDAIEVAGLAQELVDESERVTAAASFFADMKKHPENVLMQPLTDQLAQLVKTLEPKLLTTIFIATGSASINRLQPETTAQSNFIVDAKTVLRFLAGVGPAGTFACCNLPESVQKHVQSHLVQQFCERMFRTPVESYNQYWDQFMGDKLVPTPLSNYFTGPDQVSAQGFHVQAFVDLSVCALFALAVQRRGGRSISPAGGSAIASLLGNKELVSVRLRTTQRRAKSDGSHDLSKLCWAVLEKIRSEGHDSTSVVARIKEDWAVVKNMELLADALGALETFYGWQDSLELAAFQRLVENIGSFSQKQFQDDEANDAVEFIKTFIDGAHAVIEGVAEEMMDEKSLHALFYGGANSAESEELLQVYSLATEFITFFVKTAEQFKIERDDLELFKEFETRSKLLKDAFEAKAAGSAEGAEPCSQIRLWASLWIKQESAKIVDGVMTSEKVMPCLKNMRTTSIEPLVTTFLESVLSVLHDERNESAIAVASQCAGTLPKSCGAIIEMAKTYDRAKGVVDRLDRDDVVNVVEIVSVCREVQLHLVPVQNRDMRIKKVCESIDGCFNAEFAKWMSSVAKAPEFKALHNKYKGILTDAVEGNYANHPWITKAEDEQTKLEFMTYDVCRRNAATLHRVGTSLASLLKAMDPHKCAQVEQVVCDLKYTMDNAAEAKKVCMVAAIGQAVLQKPRPKNYQKNVVAFAAHFKAQGFKMDELPKHLREMYIKAVSDSSADPSAPSVTVFYDEPMAAINPQSSGAQTKRDNPATGVLAALKKRKQS